MTAQEQIAALQVQTKYQLQVIPEDGSPYADSTSDAKTDARRALATFVDGKLQDGFEFGDSDEPGIILLEKSTTVMAPVTTVERVQVRVVGRSAFDVLSPDEQDALLVADARERKVDFPIEWLPPEEQETERARRQPQPVETTTLQGHV